MSIPSGDLYRLGRVRYEDRQLEADRRRASKIALEAHQTRALDRLQNLAVLIGVALLPLGDSLRTPVSEQRSLDISTH